MSLPLLGLPRSIFRALADEIGAIWHRAGDIELHDNLDALAVLAHLRQISL
ncbi:hypothetical protein AB0C34_14140 [Nocardia sp. NPDC049220]|uniref:hypothetical protein n=1 Tax=Nocardia sp. NPDC049220 TaxID=3155273 RepID=UPI0033FCE3C0